MSQNIHKSRINEFKVIMLSTSIYDCVITLLLSFIGFYSIYFSSLVTNQSSAPRTAPAGCCSSAATPHGLWGNYTPSQPETLQATLQGEARHEKTRVPFVGTWVTV